MAQAPPKVRRTNDPAPFVRSPTAVGGTLNAARPSGATALGLGAPPLLAEQQQQMRINEQQMQINMQQVQIDLLLEQVSGLRMRINALEYNDDDEL